MGPKVNTILAAVLVFMSGICFGVGGSIRFVTHTQTIERTPASCIRALDIASEAFVAVSNSDVRELRRLVNNGIQYDVIDCRSKQ